MSCIFPINTLLVHHKMSEMKTDCSQFPHGIPQLRWEHSEVI